MSSNFPSYPAPIQGDRRNRVHSDSTVNYNQYKSKPPPFGAGWKSNSSFNASINDSSKNETKNVNRNKYSTRQAAQRPGRFYSDACTEAYKEKMSEKGPARIGAGWNANNTFHGESRRDGRSSQNESSFLNKQSVMSSNNYRGVPSDQRNVDYGRANKSFDQMHSRGRTQSYPCNQQNQDSNYYRRANPQRAMNNSIAFATYNQNHSDNREHPGRRCSSQMAFDNRQHFLNDSNINRPKQGSSDWKMSRQHDNYNRVHESQKSIHYPPVMRDSHGRSSYTNHTQHHARNENDLNYFREVQNFNPSGQNCSFHGLASSSSTSQNKSFYNQKGSSGSGRDLNTAFHQDDFSDSDWANKSILPGPSDRKQHVSNKNRGKNFSRQNVLSSKQTRYGSNWKANATFDGVPVYGQDESSVFNKTNQDMSETIAEDVSIAYGEESIDFDGNSTMDDDVFEGTGPLDTSVLLTEGIQDALNVSVNNDGISSRRIRTNSSNSEAVDKKKLFYKTKSQLNQSFAGFEKGGPSPIPEVNEETDSPMVNKVKGVTPRRDIVNNINRSLLNQFEALSPVVHSTQVKNPLPSLPSMMRKEVEYGPSDENSAGQLSKLHKFNRLSKSHEDLSRLHNKQKVERYNKLKRFKSCDVLADTVSFGVTRDTTTIYDRWDISVWVQELPFKVVAPVTPAPDWRCYTKMNKMALPIDPKTMAIVGHYIVHRGFVPRMPYILVFDNYVCYYTNGVETQMMPPKFEFDLLPHAACVYGEVVPGLYEFLDKNQREYKKVYGHIARMTRVVNTAPLMEWDEEFPQNDADWALYWSFKVKDGEKKAEPTTSE